MHTSFSSSGLSGLTNIREPREERIAYVPKPWSQEANDVSLGCREMRPSVLQQYHTSRLTLVDGGARLGHLDGGHELEACQRIWGCWDAFQLNSERYALPEKVCLVHW